MQLSSRIFEAADLEAAEAAKGVQAARALPGLLETL